MTKEDLLKLLEPLPDTTEIWINTTRDYEDHEKAFEIVKGNAGNGIGGGFFKPISSNETKFNAIELR